MGLIFFIAKFYNDITGQSYVVFLSGQGRQIQQLCIKFTKKIVYQRFSSNIENIYKCMGLNEINSQFRYNKWKPES